MTGKEKNPIIQYYLRYIENREFSIEDGVSYWRERIFNGLMIVLLIFGTFAIIPNLITSIRTGTHLITITDCIIYGSLLIMFFYRKGRLKLKISIVIFFIYLLSLVLLIELGPMGPGFVWLASCSLIAALLIGMKASLITIGLNILIILTLALLIHIQVLDTIFFTTYTPGTWIAVSSNIIVFNSITSIPLALLIQALEKSLLNEKKLKTELIKKNIRISSEKDKAQESDRLKSAFLANLSHEIRTPMNSIVGFSELIKDESQENSKLQTFSDQVIQNSRYLLNLISDIVDISLIESGQIHLHFEPTYLNDIIKDVDSIINNSTTRKKNPNIKINYHLAEFLLTNTISTDKTKLKQILLNLISNSLKYTTEGSITVDIKTRNEYVNFVVIDTGVGIPKKEQDKIFQRFSKIRNEKKLHVPGIGLGLSITKGLCQAMGGSISFTSDGENGTTFQFLLPMYLK